MPNSGSHVTVWVHSDASAAALGACGNRVLVCLKTYAGPDAVQLYSRGLDYPPTLWKLTERSIFREVRVVKAAI